MAWWVAYRSTYGGSFEIGRFTTESDDAAHALVVAEGRFGQIQGSEESPEMLTVRRDPRQSCTWCPAPAEFQRYVTYGAAWGPEITEQRACMGHFEEGLPPTGNWISHSAWNRAPPPPDPPAPPALSAWDRIKRGGAFYGVDMPLAPPAPPPPPPEIIVRKPDPETITDEEHEEVRRLFQHAPPERPHVPEAAIMKRAGLVISTIAMRQIRLTGSRFAAKALLLAGGGFLFYAGAWHVMDRFFGPASRKPPPDV